MILPEGKDNHIYNEPLNLLELASEVKDAFQTVSPFIEKHTAEVCPECEKVCCIDKHGFYDENDRAFMEALDMAIHDYPRDRDEAEPCRFLGERGCVRERWERPFRCTHFFCDALLERLEHDDAKLYRAFLAYFQHLMSLRKRLLDKSISRKT